MNINWDAAAALGAWTIILASGFAWLVRAIVSAEIKNLNGYYVRDTLCHERMANQKEELQQFTRLVMLAKGKHID